MADLKNITISELPFKNVLEDTNIIHVADGEDKQSTLARLMVWLKAKISFTTVAKDKNVLLSTSSGEGERIPLDSFSQEIMGGLLNALNPINKNSFISQGYTEVEIFSYDIARKSPLKSIGEYFYMDIPTNDILNNFLSSEEAQEYILSFGISLANGQNGSRDGRGVFLRAVDAGAGQETQVRSIGQLQEDAMQDFEASVHFTTYGGSSGTGAVISATGIARTAGGSFSTRGQYGSTVSGGSGTSAFSLTPSLTVRTSSETRPKNINALLFQKVKDIDWRIIPSLPPKF